MCWLATLRDHSLVIFQYRTRQIGRFVICVLKVGVIKQRLTPSSSAAYLVQFVEPLR